VPADHQVRTRSKRAIHQNEWFPDASFWVGQATHRQAQGANALLIATLAAAGFVLPRATLSHATNWRSVVRSNRSH
jgi:pyridoxine/pyridoxamine 5'-phosphate oxidase